MDTYSALERTVHKVVAQAESDMISKIDAACDDAVNRLISSKNNVESDYNRIIDNAKKQAENLKRQIVGNSRLSARNRQLVVVEEAVSNAFEKAKVKIDSMRSDDKYAAMMTRLLKAGIDAVNAREILVECNEKDKNVVKKIALELERVHNMKIKVSQEVIKVIGGLRIISKDGSMVYDNTVDSRIERLKPIIRKDIAAMFMR